MTTAPGIRLHDVVGTPVPFGGYLFVPSRLDIDPGVEGEAQHPPADAGFNSLNLQTILGHGHVETDLLDGAWVLARIAAAFRVPILGGWEPRKSLVLDEPFLALPRADPARVESWVPFVCTADCYESPSLVFRVSGGDASKRSVAVAFWDLMKSTPGELAPFEILQHDEDYGGLSKWECRCGRFEIGELDIDDPYDAVDSHRFDPHLAAFSGERTPCHDCDGSGEESYYPAGEPCETCWVRGVLL